MGGQAVILSDGHCVAKAEFRLLHDWVVSRVMVVVVEGGRIQKVLQVEGRTLGQQREE